MNDAFKDALHQAQEELSNLEKRREVLLRLIQNLKELSEDDQYELIPPPGYVPKGLTEEIRTILRLTTVPLDAVEIRDALVKRGIEHSSPKNLLINVHTVLGRIKDELNVTEKEAGKAIYKAKEQRASLANLSGLLDAETFKKAIAEWQDEQERKAKAFAEFASKLGKVTPPPGVKDKDKK